MRDISFKRLKDVLSTINPRNVEGINVELKSSCTSNAPTCALVHVGVSTYRVDLSVDDGIVYFSDIIKDSGVKYTCNEYMQYTSNESRIWTLI
jgi:membrane-bound inhibitor of C-type lysozyme